MCGIAGTIHCQEVTEADVQQMVSTIRYRGPDEAGVQCVGPTILGHARLAIVDPVNGTQPMSNTDDTVWVVFNGEIYNFVEIRSELKRKGYKFKSRCDTEVLVHLWRDEGEAMLDRLIGMYAFFIWDEREQRGILARDRFGIKPCFITEYKGGLAFCSEIKGLLTLPGFEKQVNHQSLVNTFAFNYCPPPETCFKGISHIKPGSYLLFEGREKPVEKTYWQWPFFDERQKPDYEEFSALIDDAVRMQMRFDVDGGLYLSGGIDSSVVGSHLIKQWNRDSLECTGLEFLEKEYSEYEFSRQAADILDLSLEPAQIDYSMLPDIAEKVSWHTEQPHGDFSFFLFYILGRKANSQGKIVMFGGDGPDETLLGFNHNVNFVHKKMSGGFSERSYFNEICYMPEELRRRLLGDDVVKSVTDPFDSFQNILAPWKALDPIEQIIAYESTSLMPGNNLVKVDRMGACWSIEGRSPYLDHRVMELFVRLPLEDKVSLGVGKKYLKNYAERIFPHNFLYGKKRMPTTPIGNWISGSLNSWAHELLGGQHHDLYDQKQALKLLDDHKSGSANHTRPLRTLIMTSLWAENFLGN